MSPDFPFRSSLLEGCDPVEALFREAPPACVIGDPPRAYRALHLPRFVNRWLQRIGHCIADPVEVACIDGLRHVQVLGQIVLRFAPDGTITPYLWEIHDILVCEEANPALINLAGMPYGWIWLERFRDAFERELAHRIGGPDHRIPAYAAWVFERIRARVRRDGHLPKMRRRIARTLALDGQALAIARRIVSDSNPRGSVRMSAYNEVVAHRADYEKLARESAALVPLFALLRPRLRPHGEPAARLRRGVLGRGVSPATWRVLHHGGGRLLRLLPEFYRDTDIPALDDLLRIVELLAPSAPPPLWFVRTLLYYFGNFGQRQEAYFHALRPLAAPLRRLMALTERAGSEEAADIRDHLYEVLTWLIDDESAADHPYARKASWRWFRRRAGEWHELQQQRARSQPLRWPVPFERIELDGIAVVALGTSLDLWEEGRAMRHCAAKLAPACAKGDTRVFSIRRPERSRPVATMRATYGKGWQLEQVAACANTVAPLIAQRIAQRVVDLLNAQGWTARGLPKPKPIVERPSLPHQGGGTEPR
ncbi:MAG: hypothetical protein OHK0044_29950 [Burkholderiaceae bacterium]